MDNEKDIFYKTLIQHHGFYMNEYYSENKKKKQYIAIKEVENGSYAVLITDEVNENIDLYEAELYMKTRGKHFSINVVVFCGESYEGGNVAEKNSIVIDKNNNIIFCSDRCRPLMNIFLNIRENINNSGVKKHIDSKEYAVTYVLIALNVLVFVITALVSGDLFNINYKTLLLFGGKYTPLILSGQYYRLITCMFLHGGLIHLACNMYSLYIVGPQIKNIYGNIKYIIIYFIAGIISGIASCIFSPYTLSVGASGAIFGLVGALLAFAFCERKNINKRYISGLVQVIIVNFIIGISMSNIDNYAHAGGVFGGFIVGTFLYMIGKTKK